MLKHIYGVSPAPWVPTEELGFQVSVVVSGSGLVTVAPQNSCGAGAASELSVSSSGIPQGTGRILGDTIIWEEASGIVYELVGVSGAVSYNWSVPGGAEILAGEGSSTIALNFDSVSGTVEVNAVNECGATDTIS